MADVQGEDVLLEGGQESAGDQSADSDKKKIVVNLRFNVVVGSLRLRKGKNSITKKELKILQKSGINFKLL